MMEAVSALWGRGPLIASVRIASARPVLALPLLSGFARALRLPAMFIMPRGPLSDRGISLEDDGPFFEDFQVGTEIHGKVGRTVTETDNVWFTLLTGNTNQIHFNEDYTRRTFPGEPFLGRRVVNGFLTIAIAAGLLVDGTSRNGFQVGLEDVRFSRPVFHGDTIYADAQVTEVRESRSRPGFGLVRIRTRGLNERRETVVEFDRIFMVRKKGETWSGLRAE